MILDAITWKGYSSMQDENREDDEMSLSYTILSVREKEATRIR